MERRERKLRHQDKGNVQELFANLIERNSNQKQQFLVLAILVLSLLSVIASANQHSPSAASSTNQETFDLDEYRLPKSITNLTTQFRLFGASQRNQISAAQPQQPSLASPAAAANETLSSATVELNSIASLDDLLAVETTRLLTIGRQQSGNSSKQAPYETATTTTTISSSSSSNNNNRTDGPNERQFVKLFRPQPPPPRLPVFIPQSFGPSSSGTSGQHNTYRPPQFQFPISDPSAGGPATTANAAPAFGGRSVITTTVAPPTWSSYSDIILNNSSRATSARGNDVFNSTAFSGHSDNLSANPTTTTTTLQQQSFPSLLSPETQTSEDQFEQSVSLHTSRGQKAENNTNWSQLLKQATESNVMESLMVTNRSMVSLLCEADDMLLRLKFRQPFNGIVMTNMDRRRVCRLVGNGSRYYEMRISLHDCGTRQEMPRLFINNIQIQFREPFEREQQQPQGFNFSGLSTLDVVDDEVKTIICSYPIRPRAPPPPAGLPERIIELLNSTKQQQDDRPAPAKLVYYEPLFLISGLLLLALALVGLTTSAYMFRRRRRSAGGAGRPRRSASAASFSSSRLYRNSPAQMANRLNLTPTLTHPPVIGLADTDNDGSGSGSSGVGARSSTKSQREAKSAQDALTSGLKYGTVVEKPYRWRTLSAGNRIAAQTDNKANSGATVARQRAIASLPKSALKKDLTGNVSVVNLRATGKSTLEQHPDSADSLATKNDRTSVTTIEIPYAANAQQAPARRTVPPPIVPKKSQALMRGFPALASKGSPTRRLSEDHSQSRRSQQQQPPRFGSLRATLTSPDEFKRLQEIARLFDEILIEKHVDKGEEGTIVVYNSRLIPSKYKTKIMDRMNEQERRLACSILSKDELFRSLVVESTDRATFRRKLRNNHVYADKFSRDAWQLLEEILLDPELSSGGESSSSSSQESDESSAASSYLIAARPPVPPPPPLLPPSPPVARVDQKQIKSIISQPDGRIADDNESIVAEFDTRQRELPNRQDSLNSPTSSISAETSQVLVEDKSLTQIVQQQDEPKLRVSQFNSTRMSRQVAGLAGTLINIDSVTNFTSSQDFSTYTRSSIEHRQFESANRADDSLPYVDEDERVGGYDYAKGSNQTNTNRRLFLKKHPPTPPKPTINNNSIQDQSVRRINR